MQRSQTATQVLGYGAPPRQARPVDYKYSGDDSWNRPRQRCLQSSEDSWTLNTLVHVAGGYLVIRTQLLQQLSSRGLTKCGWYGFARNGRPFQGKDEMT
jgi:hypothetical protein